MHNLAFLPWNNILQLHISKKKEIVFLYQHSLLNMDAYLISFNGIFNVFIQNIISFLFLIFLGFSSRRERRWRVNKTECHAYLDGLGFVFYMIELNTHDWIAFPLRFCIFCNTKKHTLLKLMYVFQNVNHVCIPIHYVFANSIKNQYDQLLKLQYGMYFIQENMIIYTLSINKKYQIKSYSVYFV